MLRDHEVSRTPLPIDRSKTVEQATPEAWKDELDSTKVSVLPLVDDVKKDYDSGWCTYTYAYQGPELEVLCGGINSKTARAGAVWRQGNLLHFGFEQSPSELNQTGKSLLVNSIAYISRFREDRPIAQTPSPFAGPAPRNRESVARFLKTEQSAATVRDYMAYYFAESVVKDLKGKTPSQISDWYDAVKPYVRSDDNGKLIIDEEARSFGVSPASEHFFIKAIATMRSNGASVTAARDLLVRYAPDGPGEKASAHAWQTWWKENQPYLFFSDVGWYRWYVDALAKKRGVPSSGLRGPKRASG